MYRSYSNSFRTSRNRPCVRCAWTGWRTWSSCAAMAPASCAGTEWASAPSAARPLSAASSSTRDPKTFFFFFLLSLSLEAHPDHARNATTTPAAAAAARPSSQHPSQPAKGVLRCLILHNKCSLNGLIVLWWNFCYKTRKKKNTNWLLFCGSVITCPNCSQKDACFTDVAFFLLCHSLSASFPPSPLHPSLSVLLSLFLLDMWNFFPLFESEVAPSDSRSWIWKGPISGSHSGITENSEVWGGICSLLL